METIACPMSDDVQNLQNQLNEIQRKFQNIETAYVALQERFSRIDTLFTIISSIGAINNLDELLRFTKKTFVNTFKLDQYSLMLFDEDFERLWIRSYHRLSKNWFKSNNLLKKETVFKKAIENKQLIHIKNLKKASSTLPRDHGLKNKVGTFVTIPLVCDENRILGILNLYKKQPDAFDEEAIGDFKKITVQLTNSLDKILTYEHTKELSITDELTGIFNRRYFAQRYEIEIQRSKRYNRKMAVLMLDIDHFKIYNDINGHLKGDTVLKKVAEILEKILRKADIVARYGGEEFVILLPEISKQQARKVANKLRKNVEKEKFENQESQPKGQLTISLGIAVYPEDSEDPESLLHYADNALYLAKSLGRNYVAWHSMDLSKKSNSKPQRSSLSLNENIS